MNQMFFGNARMMLFTSNGSSPAPAGHPETRYKTIWSDGWETVNIEGEIVKGELDAPPSPTEQIESVTQVIELEIGTNVTSIGYGAFYGCSNLTNITIPNSVTSIGYIAFAGCSSLTSVTINKNKADVEAMNPEDWGLGTSDDYGTLIPIETTVSIHCIDDDIVINPGM